MKNHTYVDKMIKYIGMIIVFSLLLSNCGEEEVDGITEASPQPGSSDITVQELMQKIKIREPMQKSELLEEVKSDSEWVLLDVRTLNEYLKEHIKGAILIPEQKIEERYKELGCPCKEIIVYSKAGYRSAIVCETLVKLGFRVKNLLGGIEAWKKAGGETIKSA